MGGGKRMVETGKKEEKTIFSKIALNTKRNKNFFLMGFLTLYVAGYFIFFSSKMWLFTENDLIEASPLQESNEYEGREITIGRWDYSKSQNMMEIELSISNLSADGIQKYDYSAIERTKGEQRIETVIEKPDFVILRIYDVPEKWREISVRLALEKDSANPFKMYMNKKDISYVSEIPERTEAEYQVVKLDNLMLHYEKNIKNLEKEIKELEAENETLESNVLELKEQEEYQTAKEVEETEQIVDEYTAKIEANRTGIEGRKSEIQEYQDRITNAELQKEDIKSESDEVLE